MGLLQKKKNLSSNSQVHHLTKQQHTPMTPRKNFEKKSPLDTKTHYTDEEKNRKISPPTKSHSCFPQKNQISLAVTPQKTFFGKNIKMHTTLKPKVSIVM